MRCCPGYLGSADQGRAILSGVARIKAINPAALYLCDPVMGHPEKGCIVPQEVSDFWVRLPPWRTSCAPTNWSWTVLPGASTLFDCLAMAKALLARGPKAVLVKHPDYPGKLPEGFEMLLVTADGSWHLRRPLLAFPRQPGGRGRPDVRLPPGAGTVGG